jgi:hypothetical protein
MNDYVKIMFLPMEYDFYMFILNCVYIFFFLADFVFRVIFKRSYFLSLFFFTDLILLAAVAFTMYTRDISFWITSQYFKLVALVRLTDVIMTFREMLRDMKASKAKK